MKRNYQFLHWKSAQTWETTFYLKKFDHLSYAVKLKM